MGRELEEQAELLKDADSITDRVQGKLAKGMKGIKYVVEKNEGSHPLLQQTALAVNPFIDLPKPPTLPPNYQSIPYSTLPPSIINAAPAGSSSTTDSAPNLPAYVSTSSGAYAAHPSTIIAQNRSLLEQIEREKEDGRKKIEEWEESIRERELQERRRKAPGWLDREERILEPAKRLDGVTGAAKNLMDDEGDVAKGDRSGSGERVVGKKDVDDLGDAMDRAFGRSEMG